jgi:formate-dependent nitrite reductase cytochrome c552 subunit
MRPRPSQRPTNVRYYAANREREIERVTRRQAATTAFLRQLRNVPCADCGGRFEGHQMDFDHRDPSTKAFNLCTGRAALKSRDQLLAEAAKCDVVCANCHRVRTRDRSRQRPEQRLPRSLYLSELERVERWLEHQDALDRIKAVPCADCDGSFPTCAMDFDHVDPRAKLNSVSRMMGKGSLELMLAEAAKCDIVCANCHRLRTYERRRSRVSGRE